MPPREGDYVFIIRPDDSEAYEVICDARDIRLWERTSPRHTLRKIAENPSMDDYYSLVHIAIKRQKLREIPPLNEWIETATVMPKVDAAASAGLSYPELVDTIDKALVDASGDTTAEMIADHVMDLLENLRERALDPTRPGH